jgi:virginiamycin A acetyltransferase
MPPDFAAPDTAFPIRLPDGTAHPGTVFLAAVLDHPRLSVGAYSYASSFDPPADPAGWAARLAPYLFEFSPERLVIGRFCQIADGALFITASANHRHDGFSTFPFAIFDDGPKQDRPSMPDPGADTVIGHDVWIGQGARILPGARIGSGAIVGAGAVVGGEIPPYAIVAGNPGRVTRRRFDAATVDRLLELCWWDWPIDRIRAQEAAICGADLSALERAASG